MHIFRWCLLAQTIQIIKRYLLRTIGYIYFAQIWLKNLKCIRCYYGEIYYLSDFIGVVLVQYTINGVNVLCLVNNFVNFGSGIKQVLLGNQSVNKT
jgi:hypothetical protein